MSETGKAAGAPSIPRPSQRSEDRVFTGITCLVVLVATYALSIRQVIGAEAKRLSHQSTEVALAEE